MWNGQVIADARSIPLASESVQCCVTSPPYWGLRSYGVGLYEIGMEPTPELYLDQIVQVFEEVRRVLKSDGTLWLNLGDTYWSQGGAGGTMSASGAVGGSKRQQARPEAIDPTRFGRWSRKNGLGIKTKDLVGIPWMVAFALRSEGWYLRSDIIWAKPNPMPESVTDRPTRSHEYLFLLTKSERYLYNNEAVAEPSVSGYKHSRKEWAERREAGEPMRHGTAGAAAVGASELGGGLPTRNIRDVWTVATRAYSEAHYATFPPELIRPCILAGSNAGDLVLDPFAGSGTVAMVAEQFGRRWLSLDLGYQNLQAKRLNNLQKQLI